MMLTGELVNSSRARKFMTSMENFLGPENKVMPKERWAHIKRT